MEVIEIIFREEGKVNEQKFPVASDMKLGEFREAAQTLLSLPDNLPCQLILERNQEKLSDNDTFSDAGIEQGDKLIIIPSPRVEKPKNYSRSPEGFYQVQETISNSTSSESLVRYALKLNIISDGNKPNTYDYPIQLEESYEDNPKRFFSDFNGRERQKFETSLQKIVSRELNRFEIDQILEEWCEDIALGYRDTIVEI